MNNFLYIAVFSGIIAMAYAFWKSSWINSQDQGTERMISIGSSIADGAMAFLRAEYRILSVFVVRRRVAVFWKARKIVFRAFLTRAKNIQI